MTYASAGNSRFRKRFDLWSKVDGWAVPIGRGCLEGMGEFPDNNFDVFWRLMYVRTSDFWFWVVDTYFPTIACGGPDR